MNGPHCKYHYSIDYTEKPFTNFVDNRYFYILIFFTTFWAYIIVLFLNFLIIHDTKFRFYGYYKF